MAVTDPGAVQSDAGLAEAQGADSAAGAMPLRLKLALVLVLLTIAGGGAAVLWGGADPALLQRIAGQSGAWGMLIYVVGVVLLELLWMPRMWGLLAGGVLFGPLLGSLLSVVGDMLGAALCFAIARGAGKQWAEQRLRQRPRAQQVVQLLARRRGLLSVAVLRVCPVAHYTLVSYAAGVGGVPPGAFLAGTAVGIIPAAVVYPLAGDSALRPGSPVFLGAVGAVLLFLVLTTLAARRLLRD